MKLLLALLAILTGLTGGEAMRPAAAAPSVLGAAAVLAQTAAEAAVRRAGHRPAQPMPVLKNHLVTVRPLAAMVAVPAVAPRGLRALE